MPKELLIYSPIWDYTAERAVEQLNEVAESEGLTVRFNSPGGGPVAGWSIISKLSERKSETNAIIDGIAGSMAAIMLLFFNNVTANDTSRIIFHKAAFPSWYDSNESEQQLLKKINSQFQEKLTKKVNGKPGAQKFLDKVFEADVRNDVELTPKEAKTLGIVNEVRKLEPTAFSSLQICAMFEEGQEITAIKKTPETQEINNNSNIENMTIEEFKSKNPELYAKVFGLGKDEGIKAENVRVGAWLAFKDIDPEAVAKGIESGKECSTKDHSEFVAKGIASAKIGAIEEENVDNTDIDKSKDKKTPEQIAAEADKNALNKEFETGKYAKTE